MYKNNVNIKFFLEIQLFEKFQRALTTLHEVSDLFKSKIEYFDDEEVEIVKTLCENWGKNWPIDFPNLNITPKVYIGV